MSPKLRTFIAVIALAFNWLCEVSAFILLPLFIYVIVYYMEGLPLTRIMERPEWMFIAIILHADTLRRLLGHYRDYRGFDVNAIRVISIGVLGIISAALFLVFTILADDSNARTLPLSFYRFQTVLFCAALLYSLFNSVWISFAKGEAEFLMRLIPEKFASQGIKDDSR